MTGDVGRAGMPLAIGMAKPVETIDVEAPSAPAAPSAPGSAQGLRPRFPTITDELLARLDVPGPRYTSYPTVPDWTGLSPATWDATVRGAAASRAALSLYVHIPFCKSMCSYCGCNVVITRDRGKIERYLDALIRELGLVHDRLGDRRPLSRIHFGGGTPTYLDDAQMERLWRAITDRFATAPGAEIAIEAAPAVTSAAQLAALAGLGFNRLSLGIQDFDPAVQDAVARHQSVEETRALVEAARRAGFTSVNFDLIYGLPRQHPDSWARTLETVIGLGPDRLAVFSFAYVPTVKPHQRKLPVADLPRGRAKLALLGQAHDALVAAGYDPIGIDHFARPDDELAVARREHRLWRDFQGYTVYRAADTLGVGASSISSVGGVYAQNAKRLPDYQAAIDAGRLPVTGGHVPSGDDVARKSAILELMCNGDAPLRPTWVAERAALRQLEADGVVRLTADRVALTELGQVFARNAAMALDAYRGAPGAPAFSRVV